MRHDSSGSGKRRSWLRRNVYWLMITAALLAIIVYREHHRRVDLHAPIPIGPPAYASAMVTFDGKTHTLNEIITLLAVQSHVRIDTFWSEKSELPATPLELRAGTYTLSDALNLVRAAVPTTSLDYLAVKYGKEAVLAGDPDLICSRSRATCVVYPVADLVVVDNPMLWNSQERMTQLADLIMAHVEPDNWADYGGSLGMCRHKDTSLIITATPEMHWRIETLLQALRDAK
jgi:hypothetical protein